MRLFIGIPIPDEWRARVSDTTAVLSASLRAKVKWVPPENAHITLKFLGSVEPDTVAPIIETLRTIAFPPFPLRCSGLGVFPHAGKPRVVWAGVAKGEAECARLAGEIEEAMAPLGFDREPRPFRCHLTLGRIKKPGQDDWATILESVDRTWPEHETDRFVLWESVLKPTGAEYRTLATFGLK